ncbi:CD209 antigen-like protein E [Patiria miniata]|uniref:C-type lectin domain-containing protein n=1 Tax=Patiria miniata TaxID=46514 RepID=A0A913Z2R0_PATMI|nr:CD209 antigen-like protein E [Patiria miniata]
MLLVKVSFVLAISSAFLVLWGWCDCVPKCCPSKWLFWRRSCYRLISPASWEASRSTCDEMGGLIAAPHSHEENEFIARMAQIEKHNYRLWIGCNDREAEGEWVCEGQKGKNSFLDQNWDLGEPNSGSSENCAFTRWQANGKWHDVSCDRQLHAVCVRDATCVSQSKHPRHYCVSLDNRGRLLNSTCLVGRVIRGFVTDSFGACGSACVEDGDCRSFNVRKKNGEKYCQLNNSTSSDDREQLQDVGAFCVYSEICEN